MNLLYDVAHNIAKLEEHTVDGKKKKVVGASQGSDAGLPGRAIRRCRRRTGQSASRSSSPATWAGRAGCWSASRAAWSGPSARPATAPAVR